MSDSNKYIYRIWGQLQLVCILFSFANCSLTGEQGPGYSFSLFNDTPNLRLAQATAKEDVDEIRRLVLNEKLDINLRESRFGQTILHLAVGTQKINAVEALLDLGAEVNIRSNDGDTPLLEATAFTRSKPVGCEISIIGMLLTHGAEINVQKDSVSKISPLSNSIVCLPQFKMLMENGAKIYSKDESYFVWRSMLLDDVYDGIHCAKFLIVDLKKRVPVTISKDIEGNPHDIWFFLDRMDIPFYRTDLRRAKTELTVYLKANPDQFCEDCVDK